MENLNEISAILALTMGAAWASGINLYATIAMLGYMGATGNVTLPENLAVLQNPLVIGAAGFMYCVEFFVDKTPGVDTAWDAMHTFIRIPAGAMLAAGAVGELGPGVELAAALLGGGLTAGSHATKAGSRVLINTSPEPMSNWTASVAEDALVVGGLWAALNHPWLFLAGLAVFILLMIWLLPKLWRGIKAVFAAIRRFFGGAKEEEPVVAEPDTAAPAPIAAAEPPSPIAPAAPARSTEPPPPGMV